MTWGHNMNPDTCCNCDHNCHCSSGGSCCGGNCECMNCEHKDKEEKIVDTEH